MCYVGKKTLTNPRYPLQRGFEWCQSELCQQQFVKEGSDLVREGLQKLKSGRLVVEGSKTQNFLARLYETGKFAQVTV